MFSESLSSAPFVEAHPCSVAGILQVAHTSASWNTHGVTSLEACGAGVRGREPGLGGALRSIASFMELFLCRPEAPLSANGGREPFCIELAAEFWRLSFPMGTSFSPKNPLSFLCMRSCTLALDPVDDTVVALAIDGLLSSPSAGKHMPLPGAKPGDIWPKFSLLSL
jgi:hypothetical protein